MFARFPRLRKLFPRTMIPALILILAVSCASSGGGPSAVHQMGERVQVGTLIYTILETEWADELPGDSGPRLPQNKFLLVRMTITNSGNRELHVPMLTLIDDQKKETMEVSEVQGVEEWLGILRNVKPAETLQGRAVFDVRPANFRIQLTDAGNPDQEKTALVELPLKLREYEKFEPGAGKTELP